MSAPPKAATAAPPAPYAPAPAPAPDVDLGSLTKFAAVSAVTGAAVAFLFFRYRVAKPNEFLAWTGPGISGVKVNKQGLQLPFQKVQSFQITSVQVDFRSKAKTKNFQPFELPGVFTIQPRKSSDALVTYAERVLEMEEAEVKRLVTSMIEGLVRASAARMDMLTLFNNRDAFKKEIENEVAEDLAKLGFEITTSNIKELEDPDGMTFFHDLSQRTLAAAHAEARVATAEANRTGETGEKAKDMETRRSVAASEMQAMMAENERDQQIAESTANLQIKQAEYHRSVEVARIQAVKAKEVREAELQAEVEQARRKQEEAQKRANDLTTTNVNAEVRVREAEGLRDAAIRQAELLRALLHAASARSSLSSPMRRLPLSNVNCKMSNALCC